MALGAFQNNAFQNNAFQVNVEIVQTITDTTILQLPINAVLAGQQDNMEEGWRDNDIRNPDFREETNLAGGSLTQLSDSASTFTVTTTKRGYD